jgi:hypothetical protein
MLRPRIQIQDLNVWYDSHHALKSIAAEVPALGITAIIGPSGCGKSTLLKTARISTALGWTWPRYAPEWGYWPPNPSPCPCPSMRTWLTDLVSTVDGMARNWTK